MNTTARAFLSIFSVLTLLIAGGCDSSDTPVGGGDDPVEPEWDYVNKGPDRWANIDPAWAICDSGQRQSPIDISVAVEPDIGNWAFNYEQSRLKMQNDSKTVHLFTDGASAMILDGQSYDLTEIHFHTTSEHTISGATFPGEVHLVHEGPNGEVAYVAVLVQAAAENKALTDILAEIPDEPGEEIDVFGFFYDPSVFLPDVHTFFRYDGSLSTPPCTENVTWVVMQNSLAMSSAQILGLRSVMGLNFRPTQPVNGRTISQ
jgi:carbonic anhydrase